MPGGSGALGGSGGASGQGGGTTGIPADLEALLDRMTPAERREYLNRLRILIPYEKREALDNGGIAAASCAAGDLNGDKRIDIVCIGSATTNLKWYENTK